MDLPKVKRFSHSPESVQLNLDISGDLNAFEGHFDAEPIIPGVVQIHWALAFAKLYFTDLGFKEGELLEIKHLEAIKFQNVIRPNAQLTLTLKTLNQKLAFAFTSSIGKHSSGKIVIN